MCFVPDEYEHGRRRFIIHPFALSVRCTVTAVPFTETAKVAADLGPLTQLCWSTTGGQTRPSRSTWTVLEEVL